MESIRKTKKIREAWGKKQKPRKMMKQPKAHEGNIGRAKETAEIIRKHQGNIQEHQGTIEENLQVRQQTKNLLDDLDDDRPMF